MKNIQIIPLGGLGEIGKNMTVIRYGEELFIIDAGLAFPDEDLLGIDVVIPDFDYLREHQTEIKALIVTHGHEDHIGAIPYFLKEFPEVPLYTTALTAALIKHKCKNHRIPLTNVHLVEEHSKCAIGSITVSFFATNHSIPDSVGVVLETPLGAIVHTGDFKIDYTPVDQRYTDFQRLGEIGKNGVLCLLSDSTNAEKSGISLSEEVVKRNLQREIVGRAGRVIIATFASSLYRVQSIFSIAQETNRKVAVIGRSMENNVKVASKLGKLHVPSDLLISPKEIGDYPEKNVLILTTGAQGEPLAGLSRIAHGDHAIIEANERDTVIFSSSPIPGNERSVSALIDVFLSKGVQVVYGKEKDIHTSGHGNQEEQKLMLSILRPRYFIPAHGEYRMLKKHKELAVGIGVQEENIFLCENGDVIDIDATTAKKGARVQAGAILVDNSGLGEIDGSMMRDRKRLAEHGVAVVQATVKGKGVKPKVEFVLRGMVAKYDKRALHEDLQDVLSAGLEGAESIAKVKKELYKEIGSVIYRHVKRKPTIILLLNNFRKKEGFARKMDN